MTEAQAESQSGAEDQEFEGADDGIDAPEVSVVTIKPGNATNFPTVGQVSSTDLLGSGLGRFHLFDRPASLGQTVRIHYEGKLSDGTEFDSSRKRGRAFEFTLGSGNVIEGLDRAILQMSRGQRAKVSVPPELAYGSVGYPPVIPPNATLIFEVELMSFTM
eukprot:scaffold733_cov267-Pinguiococcus_pyrenoidosus.AAC.37